MLPRSAPIAYRVAMPEPGVARVRGRDARPGAARPRQPPRSSSRPGRPAATWCATSSATCTGLTVTDARGRAAGARAARQAALADRDRRARRSACATACSRSRRPCARRSSTTATPTGTAPACSSSSRASWTRPCRVTVAPPGAARAGGSPPRCRPCAGAAQHLRAPPTSTSWCDAPFEVGTHAHARVHRRAHPVRAGALRPHQRRRRAPASTSSAGSSPRPARCSAASRSTATCSSCTRCRSARAASSTARR